MALFLYIVLYHLVDIITYIIINDKTRYQIKRVAGI